MTEQQKTIIQIYESQTPDETGKLISLGVDHIGSVLLDPDHIEDQDIYDSIRMIRASGSKSSLIPLFRDPDKVITALSHYQPDIVHFCDALEPDSSPKTHSRLIQLQERVKNTFPEMEIMRSIPIVRQKFTHLGYPTLALAGIFAPVSDWFLTDTLIADEKTILKDQPVEGFVGITGKTCDWDTASRLVEESPVPVILAGGIHPENAFSAVIQVRPHGIDSCTGTNRQDAKGNPVRFQKDFSKVEKLILEVRRAEEYLAGSKS